LSELLSFIHTQQGKGETMVKAVCKIVLL